MRRTRCARFRDAFTLPHGADGHPLIYLCGHSLGLAPDSARTLVNEELDDWDRLAVLGHHAGRRPWIGYAEQLQDGLARLTGASPGEVVAMNSLTVNLHLLMASFYRPTPQRHRIVIEAGAFPSDRHAVASQIAWHGFDPAEALIELAPHTGTDVVEESQLEALLAAHGDNVALVLWPGVQYLTRPGLRHRARGAGRASRRRALRHRPCAFHRQPAVASARSPGGFRGLVQLQIPQRRTGRHRRRLRAFAPQAIRTARACRLVGT